MQSLKQQGCVKKKYTSLSSPLLFSLILLFAPLDLLQEKSSLLYEVPTSEVTTGSKPREEKGREFLLLSISHIPKSLNCQRSHQS